MRFVFLALIQMLMVSATIQGALANGAPYVPENAMGGIKFKNNEFISIEEEVLHIVKGNEHKESKIRVSYTFRSFASQPITLDIAFPTARSDFEMGYEGGLDFKLTADGKDVTTKRRVVYFDTVSNKNHEARDISSSLERARISQSNINKGFYFSLSEEAKSILKEEGVQFSCQGDDDKTCWIGDTVQEVFTWQQVFKPGLTKIEVSYQPKEGEIYASSHEEAKDYRDMFCFDKPVELALIKPGRSWHGITVGYIWDTARYWKGPIKNFHLIIEKGDPGDIVSYCPTVGRKISPTRFEWHTTNFVPKGTLSVLFVTSVGDASGARD